MPRYLVQVVLRDASAVRIRQTAPTIRSIIEDLSGKDYQLAYTSQDSSAFAFVLRSDLSAVAVATRISSPGVDHGPVIPSPLAADDKLLVVELGEDSYVSGLGHTQAWLTHHKR